MPTTCHAMPMPVLQMRMSGLSKVEMSGFIGAGGRHGSERIALSQRERDRLRVLHELTEVVIEPQHFEFFRDSSSGILPANTECSKVVVVKTYPLLE